MVRTPGASKQRSKETKDKQDEVGQQKNWKVTYSLDTVLLSSATTETLEGHLLTRSRTVKFFVIFSFGCDNLIRCNNKNRNIYLLGSILIKNS